MESNLTSVNSGVSGYRSRVTLIADIMLFILGAALGWGVISRYDREPNTTLVRAAYIPGGAYLPFLVLERFGLLEKRGFTLDLNEFSSIPQLLEDFLNNDYDVTAHSAVTLLPIEEANPGLFKFIYGQYARSYFFIVPESSDIRVLGDLNGKKIATWDSPTAEVLVTLVLDQHALQPGSYVLDRLPDRLPERGWVDAIKMGTHEAAFGFGMPAAALQAEGYRFVTPEAVASIARNRRVFNGGAIIRTRLLSRHPDKARAIRDALLEALEMMIADPEMAKNLVAEARGLTPDLAAGTVVDEFVFPSQSLIDAASRFEERLIEFDVLANPIDVQRLFWVN